MRRLLALSLTALLTLTAAGQGAGFLCLNSCVHCMVPPPPRCPDCSCPCDHGLHLCSQRKSEHAHKLIDQLCDESCCVRIKAAKKLGCRLHADFCCDHEVLTALIGALQCDPCWEVRAAAAWAIEHQNARTQEGVLALYVASKADPHYLVRVAAAEGLDILIINKRECFTQLLKGADVLIVQLRKLGYKPGSESCKLVFASACGACGIVPAAPPPVVPGGPPPEPIPAPKPPVKPAAAETTPLSMLPVPGTALEPLPR